MNVKHCIAIATVGVSAAAVAAAAIPIDPVVNPATIAKDENAAICGESQHDGKAAVGGAIAGCAAGFICSLGTLGLDAGACFLLLCGAGGALGAIASDEAADAIDGATDCEVVLLRETVRGLG